MVKRPFRVSNIYLPDYETKTNFIRTLPTPSALGRFWPPIYVLGFFENIFCFSLVIGPVAIIQTPFNMTIMQPSLRVSSDVPSYLMNKLRCALLKNNPHPLAITTFRNVLLAKPNTWISHEYFPESKIWPKTRFEHVMFRLGFQRFVYRLFSVYNISVFQRNLG